MTSITELRDTIESAIEEHVAAKYDKRFSWIANHDWDIEEISRKLELDGWPQQDISERQEIYVNEESDKKRKRQSEIDESLRPSQKIAYPTGQQEGDEGDSEDS
jgi:hypothetical protein